jgi:hypothetical protein
VHSIGPPPFDCIQPTKYENPQLITSSRTSTGANCTTTTAKFPEDVQTCGVL